jgi:hypothetical protein
MISLLLKLLGLCLGGLPWVVFAYVVLRSANSTGWTFGHHIWAAASFMILGCSFAVPNQYLLHAPRTKWLCMCVWAFLLIMASVAVFQSKVGIIGLAMVLGTAGALLSFYLDWKVVHRNGCSRANPTAHSDAEPRK